MPVQAPLALGPAVIVTPRRVAVHLRTTFRIRSGATRDRRHQTVMVTITGSMTCWHLRRSVRQSEFSIEAGAAEEGPVPVPARPRGKPASPCTDSLIGSAEQSRLTSLQIEAAMRAQSSGVPTAFLPTGRNGEADMIKAAGRRPAFGDGASAVSASNQPRCERFRGTDRSSAALVGPWHRPPAGQTLPGRAQRLAGCER